MKDFRDYKGVVPEKVYNQIKAGNYEGDIEEFPPEVVLGMVECQIEQGNVANVGVFERRRAANEESGGFDWPDLGYDFKWSNIILNRDFESFFKRYPKDKPVHSLGARRVKLDYVPSEKDVVYELRKKAAELIDLIESVRGEGVENGRLIEVAQTEVETGCMYAVKAVFTK